MIFFPYYIPFSHSIGKVISVLSPSRMQQQRRLGSRFTSMSLVKSVDNNKLAAV